MYLYIHLYAHTLHVCIACLNSKITLVVKNSYHGLGHTHLSVKWGELFQNSMRASAILPQFLGDLLLSSLVA